MPSAAYTLLDAFLRLCTFRLGPQDIPKSSVLLAVVSLLNIGISTIINHIQLNLASAVLVAVIEMAVLCGLTALLLFYFSHLPRMVQTLTALMGCGALIGMLVLVLLQLFPRLPDALRVLIFLWNLLVMAHILKHALEIHFVAAFFCALGYALALIQMIVLVGRSLGAVAA